MSLVFGLTGCLLGDPINVAPEVTMMVSPGPYHRGLPIAFAAAVGNENSLSFAWEKAQGPCAVAPRVLSVDGDFSNSFSVTPAQDELGALCVRVQVKDKHGAITVAQTQIYVEDRPPVVALTQVLPAPGAKARLGTEVVVSAVATDPDPGDVPAFTLGLKTPEGKDLEFGTCEDAERPAHEHCFVVTTRGSWMVEVHWAADAKAQILTGPPPATLSVMADDDQPPCLVATPQATQLVHDARTPLLFDARVVDDLDAFPTTSQGKSQARFQWSVADPSGIFLSLVDQTDRTYVLPNRYLPADEVRVRVDVFDRVVRPVTCPPTEDVCGTPLCLQRMTWTVRFR